MALRVESRWLFALPHVVLGWLAATAAAAAADLPPAPEPIDYVRACKAEGDGYFAVPGTDTCVSIFGYVQAEYMVFASNAASRQPGWYSPSVSGTLFRARSDYFMYSVSHTDAGPLKTFLKFEFTENDKTAVQIDPKELYITYMGITAGRNQSFYDFYTGNTFEDYYEPAWSDFQTLLLGYTFDFGKGVTATVALEDAVTRNLGIKFGGPNLNSGPGYGGPVAPDVVANLNLGEDWGSAQIMGAVHQLRAARGRGGDKTGYGLGGGVTVNLPFLGAGDSATLQGNFAHGALAYTANNPVGPGRAFSGADAVLTGGRLELATSWSGSFGITHNWNDKWSSTLEGSYLSVDQALARFSFTNIDLQANLIYAPVTDLQLGIESEFKQIGRRGHRADGAALMTMFVIQKDF